MTIPAAGDLDARDRATWTLWADWCAAVDEHPVPATPAVLARFIALIVALIFGSTAWAIVCVVIAAAGIVLFIVDWIRHRKNRV